MRKILSQIHPAKLMAQCVIFLTALLFNFNAKAQDGCMMVPLQLNQRVQQSAVIVEGKVVSQETFWGIGQRNIFKRNTVLIYKIFKGAYHAETIDLITQGGIIDDIAQTVSPSLQLNVGDVGMLLCIPNAYADAARPGYNAHGAAQGFLFYDENNGTAHDPFKVYKSIEDELYKSIKKITKKSFVEIKSNPFFETVRRKLGSNNINNANRDILVAPTISGFSPTSIASGTAVDSQLTITGTNFGSTQGTGFVEFRNANDSNVTWVKPLASDYVSWSATQIVVKVPSTSQSGPGAGTGQIRVTNSDPNTTTSGPILTVTYAYSNVNDTNNARMPTHITTNSFGGYTFAMSSAFSSNTSAVTKLRTVLKYWTCTTGVNWLLGGNTTAVTGRDGINSINFSSTLSAGVLATCYSYYSGCGTVGARDWKVVELDIDANSTTNWYYGTGSPSASQMDFESVLLHEAGHGHQLGHSIDVSAVMHYSISNGQVKRTLNANEIAGGTYVKNRDLAVGTVCSSAPMTLLTCNAAISAPSVTFTANRTSITTGCAVTFTSEVAPEATSWSWNFGGGAAASTLENPTVTFNTPGTYSVTLTAGNAFGSTPFTRSSYIVVTAPACSSTDTNFTGTQTDYGYTGGGRLAGHNVGGDLAFADKFTHCGFSRTLTQVKLYINLHSGTGSIVAKVWNADGAAGAPGTVLASKSVTIASLVTGVNTITLDTPVAITADYYIGYQITYAGSDAVSLISNQQGQSATSTGWRMSSGSVWASYLSLYGLSLTLRVEGVFNSTPTASITPASATTFCNPGSVVLNANTGSGLTYLWFKNAASLGVTTSSYTATSSGSYTVQVTYGGCSATSAATVVTANTCTSTNANLSNLTASAGTLSPAFLPATLAYTISVPNATTSTTVTPTVADATATVTVNGVTVTSGSPSGSIALAVGSNVITIIVTAQDGTTTKTYTITITRAPSTNANLSNLVLSSGTLSPVFASGTTSYTSTVPFTVTSVTVTPTVTDATATIKVNTITVASGSPSGAIALNVGSNTITTIVTAQDGSTTKTYTVTITRAAASTNTNLSNLTASAGTLTPAFVSTTLAYTLSVPNATISTTVTPTLTDATATVKVNGVTVASGSPSGSIALNVGSNVITTLVTAQDGTTTKTYTITITRAASTNADLSNLTASAGAISPTFASATLSYTLSVANAMASTTVTPTVSDATATVKVNGVIVASGSPSGAIALNVGSNVITTVVTAQDGTTTKSYAITITRAASANADLSNLTASAGALSPVFAAATVAYTLSVPNATASTTVTPTVSDATATVKVNGVTVASGSPSASIALNVGSNVITTVVTAQDGTTTKTYTITITRAGSNNANLSGLAVSSGVLSPAFTSATITYTLSVPFAVNSITVTPTVTDATATIRVNTVTVASGTPSGAIALNVGSNTISTVVTAQDGTTTKTYTITVTRAAASTNANLSNLTASAGALSPIFAAATVAYTISVPNATASTTVTPTVSDATATVKVNGVTVASGSPSASIALNVGSNVITTVVTAQDGTTTKTYTITITRAGSNNTNLSGLAVSSGVLSPAFTSATITYTLSVPFAVNSITVTPTLTDATATIKVNTVTVASGTPSGAIALNVGSNTISTVVTAQDGTTTKTYTITVTRAAASTNANLSNLTASAGALSPIFAAATVAYTISVPNATASTTVTPTVSDATATVKVNGVTVASGSPSASIALNVGSNVITTVVTAQDGTTTKSYTITITRAGSNNANLSGLAVSSGVLSPAFTSATITYTLSVPFAVNSITVTPTVTDATATIKVNTVTVASGTPSGAIALNVGSNTISTVVTAQDGTTTKTYTITVTRAAASTNANLSNLTASAGALSPIFAAATVAYTISVPNATASTTVTPTVSDATATVKVNGVTVTSGSPSASIALNVGSNVITTIVTAQDGTTTKTYTITVTRAAAPSASIVNLTVFIEGYYVGGNTMTSVMLNQDGVSSASNVEMITIELHHATTFATVASTTAMLHTDGTLSASFPTSPIGSFYIAVKGRNMAQTWSANPQPVGNTALSYNFTTAASKAYGDNMISVGSGVFAFYSGDVNQDEVIDNSDLDTLFPDIENSNFGDLPTDLNGDGVVDNSDLDNIFISIENSRYSIHP